MIRIPYIQVNEDIIYTVHPESKEEAEELGFPKGVYVAYEQNGTREYAPGRVMQLVIQGHRDGTIKRLQNIQQHKTALIANQNAHIVKYLERMKQDYIEGGQHPEMIQHIDTEIQKYTKGINLTDTGVRI